MGVSAGKGSKMAPVGNDMKSRKNEEKIHETEELPKTVSRVAVCRLSTDKGMNPSLQRRQEDGNSSSAEVMSRLLEEREVTILADLVDVPVSTAQSYQLSDSLNKISVVMTEEATGS